MTKKLVKNASHGVVRKICVVTGSRADYGLLYWFMKEVQSDPGFDLQLIVTGMHLSPEFGLTLNVIEDDGFPISARVETLLSSDSGVGVAKATGLGVIGFADAFQNLQPDLVVVLGDRFEIFAVVQAALFLRIPVAHIGGGDVTAGAFDEAMRHGISKMAHLHFVTNDEAAARLKRMGEAPHCIFNVGSPGLDHLHRTKLMERDAVEHSLSFEFRERNFLVTFHPVTLDRVSSDEQLVALLQALNTYAADVGIIFTLPNADTGGRSLIEKIHEFVDRHANVRAYESLGQERYLGALSAVDVVIGNSSSGLYEAPSLGTPTVNIGKRQDGRLKASSVFDCTAEPDAIVSAIEKALAFSAQTVQNPYQQGDAANLMLQEIRKVEDFSQLVMKHFHDEPT